MKARLALTAATPLLLTITSGSDAVASAAAVVNLSNHDPAPYDTIGVELRIRGG